MSAPVSESEGCDLPVCSVIIVTFNSGETLSACVDAVLASTLPVEVLISDNASGDGSIAALRQRFAADLRLRVSVAERNRGFAAAANAVLDEARGQWLLFLNPDCIVRPDTLTRMLEVWAGESGIGLAGCLLRNPDGSEQRGSRRHEPTPLRSLGRVLRLGRYRSGAAWSGFDLHEQPVPVEPVAVDAISGAFMLTDRAALSRVGPLDAGYFLHCEDLDWCRRFRDAGYRVVFVPQVEVVHYQGTSSRHRRVRVEWHKHRGMLRYYRKFFLSEYSWPMAVAVWLAVWIRFSALALFLGLRRGRA